MAAYDLRPMALGELLDRGFTIYRRNFAVLTGISAVALLLPYLLMATGVLFSTQSASSSVVLMIAGMLVFIVSYTYSIAAMTHAVSMILLGEPAGIGKAYERMRGQAVTVFLVGLLNALGVMFGLILLVIPGLIFSVRWAVGIPTAVLENIGPVEGLRRSWHLTAGFGGTIFLMFLLQGVVSFVFSLLLQTPFTLLATFGAASGESSHVWMALAQIGGFLANMIVFPIAHTLWCLLYYDLRIRKEGFDLEQMMRMLDAPGSATPPRPVA